ncbi:glycoside hydrolase family 5 protein [Dysgonomonas macrotermitis]|uniref:Endoglucanase n=1 Tax=Dysgonomonas macrotermitis TaxID=1346286 RepID=A0A1M5F955_9BACT|nr:glycoside hydrolase family 5 protein [Dysgonomonas macrotermitis]SHF87928.1 endoglucanase [Dysgonomonas macrotermitis]
MRLRLIPYHYLLLILFCISPTFCLSQQSVFVGRHRALSVKGTALTDSHGDTVVLKGVSLGWHNWWPRFYNEKTIDWLVDDFQVNVVRAAVGVGVKGGYHDDPEQAFRCLYNVVDAAIKNDVYVIVDWHSHGIYTDDAKEFFTKVATRYHGYSNIIYEIFNEPVDQPWTEIKAYSEEVISAIRSIDKNNLILVGTPHWDQDVDIAADDPIIGYDNIMYTLHFYAATHKQELRKKADYALSKGLPLFVSECAGMEASGDGKVDIREWQRWQDWMSARKISWAVWSIADKNESCSMIVSPASPASDWLESDLKEWGRITRTTLRNK